MDKILLDSKTGLEISENEVGRGSFEEAKRDVEARGGKLPTIDDIAKFYTNAKAYQNSSIVISGTWLDHELPGGLALFLKPLQYNTPEIMWLDSMALRAYLMVTTKKLYLEKK